MDQFDNFYYHDSNYNRKYTNDKFYSKIISNVSSGMKRPLSKNEQRQVVDFINKLDPDVFKPANVSKSITIINKTLINEFTKFDCYINNDIDTHQILRDVIGTTSESGTSHGIYDNPDYLKNRTKRSTNVVDEQSTIKTNIAKIPVKETINKTTINSLLGLKSADDAARILNPSSQYKKNYMLLDSRYRNVANQSPDNIINYSWNYVQKNQETTPGSVNVIGNVRDIIALQIHPFRIPYSATADNRYSRISVLIDELSSQSFIAHENRKFHWLMQSAIDSQFIDLSNDNYKDSFFIFEKPITTLETLTLSFGNPLEQILLDRDRDFCTFDYFTLAPLTQITTEKVHNLSNGDRIYIESFTVGFVNPILFEQKRINDSIQSDVNNISGYLVTVIDANNISISLDTSNIQAIDANTRPRIFYGSKRTFIPITIHYINPKIDGSH